ncbi:hypothetical protein PF005_g15838 [Phytophthora fragariae]|uniref:Uncharacterized protein n=1 Tax=Phytophthora fragariae TaxID=53985 RepID=A0A6A3JS18_9STRA|nr:hypothetical protein PF003_g24415 [Phytophthora fragariae]KAE8932751.1 hypothetical protein PF009_g17226 [Phytophthora fragariae]KAE8998156.1 hypothetical protein PF011_g15170 [Phytophthora fragariae]KAE9114357.1 hypothetical protein PF007_g10397 [Phytophthora fragariae]KAE9115032.1 hypothetical protein PF010_g9497 [Phytophthora fragariae]
MRTSLLSAALLSLALRRGVSADTSLVSACSAALSDSSPPVLEPLRAVIGDQYTDLLVGLLGHSAASKFLISDAGSSCLANMNGTALGQALAASSAVDTCANALALLNVPLVQDAMGNLSVSLSSSNSDSKDSATDAFIEGLRLVDEEQVEQICALYVDGFVPCLRSQLLPSLATLRSTSAGGCCAAWEAESVSLVDYTITGQYSKAAQLLGDVFCATQTPAFNGSSSQRCGYTFLQSSGELANTTAADRAAALLEDLRVPRDQACHKAEGEAYNDSDGNAVAAVSSDQYTASGCVVALDRIATWIDGRPLADNSSESYGIDLQSLFGAGKCVNGADVFPVIQDFLPSSIVDAMSASFSDACLHVPMKYADGCSFSRPASLVDWNYDPPHASQAGSEVDGDGTSAINSLNTVPPNVTADSSAAISHGPAVTTATLLGAVVMALW